MWIVLCVLLFASSATLRAIVTITFVVSKTHCCRYRLAMSYTAITTMVVMVIGSVVAVLTFRLWLATTMGANAVVGVIPAILDTIRILTLGKVHSDPSNGLAWKTLLGIAPSLFTRFSSSSSTHTHAHTHARARTCSGVRQDRHGADRVREPPNTDGV